MAFLPVRPLLLAALLTVAFESVEAQRPTASQVESVLRARPELVQQLRDRFARSGMTPEQIRAQLRAAGYPPALLDGYLPGGRTPSEAPSGLVYSAVLELGLADSTEVQSMRMGAGSRSDMLELLDSLAAIDGADSSILALRDSLRRQAQRDSTRERRPRETVADSGRTIFGLSLFERDGSEFDANLAGPVDESYRLGPGDRLVLILTGDVEEAYTLDVTREGFVVIPEVGQLAVANLTLGALEELLYSRLARVHSGIRRGASARTRFSVHVARLRTNQVIVTGDVKSPGSVRISGAGTALTALYAAGGPTSNGSMRRVEIRRGGRTVATLDLYDYLLRGDASRDVRLENGDVVFVPVHGPRVRIWGEILRPATYEVLPGETLADVVRGAGSFTAEATRKRIQVARIVPVTQRGSESAGDRIVLELGADQIGEYGPPLPVENGDVVRVFPVPALVRNSVVVSGSVWAPGEVGFTPGMRVSDAVRLAGGITPDAYLGRLLVTRVDADSTRTQLRTAFRDSTGAVSDDLVLEAADEIEIFTRTGFRADRHVEIAGAVRNPRRVEYREGMTLRDLVLLAGGLEERAYLERAEIARTHASRERGETAITIRVALDSSYLDHRARAAIGNGNGNGNGNAAGNAQLHADVVLEPYDHVLVLTDPEWEPQRTVYLGGEVRFPGTYALTSRGERMSDLVARAGGLSDHAYADGVSFHRTGEEIGRIGVDLSAVLANARHRDNMLLQDGDSIHIPRFIGVVHVQGAVNAPVAVAYVDGGSLEYYIRAAGGASATADTRRAYVTQPNGKVQGRGGFPGGAPRPRPGSTVYIPEQATDARRDYLAIATVLAQITASLVTIYVVTR